MRLCEFLEAMGMIDLWLDDNRDPQNPEHQQRKGAHPGMTWVKTAQEAINLLKTGKVKSISFDHDLGPRELVGDGYQVAKFVEADAANPEGTLPRMDWRVHSDNGVGARNIVMAMTNAERFWSEKGM